jgi:hypothetical protein
MGFFGREDDLGFECPRCGGQAHSVRSLRHPVHLHWVLNPGLAVNELILGQRVPRKIFFCQSCPGPAAQRGYVYCPGCGAFHSALIWSGRNAFGHWLGAVCPDCRCRIPSVLNITSWLVLSKLSPVCWLLWWLFGSRYLSWEQTRSLAARERRASRCLQ